MSGYIGVQPVPQTTQTRDSFTATAGQTSFGTSGYQENYLDVYLNGVKLAATDYTATNGSDVVLSAGAAVNDILEVVAFGTFEVANQTFTGTTTINTLTVTNDGAGSNLDADQLDGQHGAYYTGYTDTQLAALVDSSPAALNTLNELAAALGDDANFSTTVTNSIATKLPLAGGTMTGALDVQSTITSDGLTVDGTPVRFNSTAPMLYFMESGVTDQNHRIRQNFGNLYFQKLSDDENTATTNMVIDGGTGDISFYEDTGTTAKFFWDASAEKLGLGTTSPDHPITIQSSSDMIKMIDAQNTSVYHRLYSESDSSLVLSADAGNANSGQLRFFTADTERMVISSSGSVDITGKLEVSANNNAGAKANYIRITDTDTSATAGNQQGGIEFFSNDVTPGIAASIEVLYAGSGGGGELTFNTNVNSQGTLTEAVRIDENGNVGIGTSSPSVNGLEVSGSGDRFIFLQSSTSDDGVYIKADSGGDGTEFQTAGGQNKFGFRTNGSLALTIDSSGVVEIPNSGVFRASSSNATKFVRMYAGGGTGKWDIYGNGANLRISDNMSAGVLAVDTGATFGGDLHIGTDSAGSYPKTGHSIRGGDSAIFSRTGSTGETMQVRRQNSTGEYVRFYSGASTIHGGIKVDGGSMVIGGGDVGIGYYQGANALVPYNYDNKAVRDAAIDLGYPSTYRWKDLYLSGGVYLGGTGAANKLDDYEEGTWTPAFNNVAVSYTERYGKYTKIGDTVHLWGYMVISSIANTDTSYVNMGGMPFTSTGGFVNGSFYNGSGNASLLTTTTLGAAWTVVSQNYFYLGIPSSTNNLSYAQACNSSGRFWFSMTYPTAS